MVTRREEKKRFKSFIRLFSRKKKRNNPCPQECDPRVNYATQREEESEESFYTIVTPGYGSQQVDYRTEDDCTCAPEPEPAPESKEEPEPEPESKEEPEQSEREQEEESRCEYDEVSVPGVVRVDTMHADVTIPRHARCGEEFTIEHDGLRTIKVPCGQQGRCIRVRMIRTTNV